MINLIKKTWFPITIIGTCIIAFNMSIIMLSNTNDATILTTKYIKIGDYTSTILYLDIRQYLINLSTATNIKNIFNITEFPQMYNATWTGGVVSNIKELALTIVNGLIYVVNVIIWTINTILLLTLKFLLYIIINIGTLLGINYGNKEIWNQVLIIYKANIQLVNYLTW